MAKRYVTFEPQYCTGCTKCVRACPTRAIRIREAKAVHFSELCIGCSECIRVCPEGAVYSALTARKPVIGKYAVAIVSPVLYAQFPATMPCDVLTALKNLGFYRVVDLSFYLEMFQSAMETFIRQNRQTRQTPWPLISPICPVVTRLIALKHPNLLAHIAPIKRPAAMASLEVRNRLSRQDGIDASGIKLYHITPCPSKALSRDAWLYDELAEIEQALGINEIYPQLCREVEKLGELDMQHFTYDHFCTVPDARGPQWGVSGGEISGLESRDVLAVSGLREVMHYIEKIEMGLFSDTAYIELRGCPESCVGGPLTAVDKYVAKSTVQKLVGMYGVNRRLPADKLKRRYDRNEFFTNIRPSDIMDRCKNISPPMSIDMLQQIELLLNEINGTDCGACGAPDCRTFAEDVIRGDAERTDCFKLRGK
ncbi:MAG: [Fe-Fe] hydrogenase large subunit C-terminal domain-containing protein [Thermodesulfobacteriota bacterium]